MHDGSARFSQSDVSSSEPVPASQTRESGARLRTRDRRGDDALAELRAKRDAHPLWRNKLLVAFEDGALNIEDFRYVFSQYYLYARSHTRHVAALLTTCESDVLRARLVDALWAEGAGHEPELRASHIFRRFLARALGVTATHALPCEDATRALIDECHRICLTSTPLAASAFLALGIEGITPRLHALLAEGLRKAGVDEADRALFEVHAECTEATALEQAALSYAHHAEWRAACEAAMELALGLHDRFFTSLFEGLRLRRVKATLDAIQDRVAPNVEAASLRHRGGGERKLLYISRESGLSIEFVVERIPLGSDVLDARMIRIPAQKHSEEQGHAHETLLHVLRGWGAIVVGEKRFDVVSGDTVLVPRWSSHRVMNLGESELVSLAVTDFHLVDKAFIGDARTYRR